MFSLDELSKRVAAYREGRVSFAEFQEWYRDSSWGFYDRSGDALSDAISGVEAAIASYEVDGASEDSLRLELGDALRAALVPGIAAPGRPSTLAQQTGALYGATAAVESSNNSCGENHYGVPIQTVGSNSSCGFIYVGA